MTPPSLPSQKVNMFMDGEVRQDSQAWVRVACGAHSGVNPMSYVFFVAHILKRDSVKES